MPITFTRAAIVAAAFAVAACTDTDGGLEPTSNVVQSAQADLTLDWNAVALGHVAAKQTSVPASIRLLALMSVAQYDAMVTAAQETQGATRPSERGAIAGASAAVLSYIYPNDRAIFDAMVAAQAAASSGAAFAAGETIGRRIAATLVARAETDRFFAPFTGTVPSCAGCWVATPTAPAFATLGQAKPFLLESSAQFRPAPPPAFGSLAFAAALNEVRQVADTRTPAQDSIAKFWALPLGTVGAQGYFNKVATELAAKYHRSERETARLLALLNVAAFDGIIASHEAKYHYWLLRPHMADAGIVRAIGQPSFPAYPSNHSMLAGVAAAVIAAEFPAERARLDAMAAEGAISRLYGGIHYRFDTEAGLALGRKVAEFTIAKAPKGQASFDFK